MNDLLVINNYRDREELRLSFNKLAQQTFDIDFENWYQNGYWGADYNPYSIIIHGEVVANVSVNINDIVWNGVKKHYIQLGTVMVDPRYRQQGYIRQIMRAIEADFVHRVDGVFLFANDSVLDFYPRFGFRKIKEHQYSKEVQGGKHRRIQKIPMKDKSSFDVVTQAIEQGRPCGCFEMANNSNLVMFYVSQYMKDNVYYDEFQEAIIIAEENKGELMIYDVFSPIQVNLDKIIEGFGESIHKVTLGFVPKNKMDYDVSQANYEDTTLFVLGNGFEGFEEEKLMFPLLAHA